MDGERLGDLPADRHAAIERAEGILEDELHAGAQLAPGLALGARQRLAVERTSPLVGSSRPSAKRPVVDLPQPDSPTRPSVRPRSSVSDTPATASTVRAGASSRRASVGARDA